VLTRIFRFESIKTLLLDMVATASDRGRDVNGGPAGRPIRNFYTQATSLLGTVTDVQPDNLCFTIRCRSGDEFVVNIGPTTWFTAVRNTDDLDRDRVANPDNFAPSKLSDQARKYVRKDDLIMVEGVEIDHAGQTHFEGRKVTLLAVQPGRFLFEDTHWWLTQIACFAD
jgi:hypothetical protein